MKIISLTIISALTLFIACTGNNSNNANQSTNQPTDKVVTNRIFARGPVITGTNAAYFDGTAYLNMMVTDETNFDCTVGNVTFEAGCKNNWHSHPGGQLLLVTAGEGYYQEKGKPIQLIKTGDVIEIHPNVVHWHGATPDSMMEHISIVTRSASMGPAAWFEPLSDEDYYSYNK